MNKKNNLYQIKNRHILMLGFGSVGQVVIELLFQFSQISTSQISIISRDGDTLGIAKKYGVALQQETITPSNYKQLIDAQLQSGDFLLNLSVGVSSIALMEYCQQKGILYLDTCTEPWEGGYVDNGLPMASRTNYSLRESALRLKAPKKSTALITHGANPGLISHLLKQALLNVANDTKQFINQPKTAQDWSRLSQTLGIKSIHIAERDTQVTPNSRLPGEFVNTWSVDGFLGEAAQPAELGWGTHERFWPQDAHQHENGPKCAIYLENPGAGICVRSWTPNLGAAHGFLITHAESISLANFLTLKNDETILYRPTVLYAYVPCPDAILSLHEFASNEWLPQTKKRIIFEEITDGSDALGVLLMGNSKGSYWFGSQLTIHQARKFAPSNNATGIQVAIGVIAGMLWVIDNPTLGVIEPEDIDHEYILNVSTPFLGEVGGYYTNWNPIQNRELLFKEKIDRTDPWQFINFRVNNRF